MASQIPEKGRKASRKAAVVPPVVSPTAVVAGATDDTPRTDKSRRLVFCFDGSWNKLDTKKHPTNVVLIAESILPIDRNGVQQIVYYDEGVGTSSDDYWRGGIFGKGIEQNIRDAYRFLLFNFLPGDEIFVFGFSRGAFTARSFIGFIRMVGIIRVNDASQISQAWKLYKRNAARADEDLSEALEFREKYCPHLCISASELDWRRARTPGTEDVPVLRIAYCGVWDTVGTLGWKAITSAFDRTTDKRYSRHDTELSATVEAARHAVAIDERRVHFMPTLWRNVRALNEAAQANHYDDGAPFQQKWFAGDHGSVGGGGPERGLSNAALHWVLRGAVNQGLRVSLEGRSQLDNIRYDARAPLSNSPADGVTIANGAKILFWRALGFIKDLILTAARSGPSDPRDLHPSVLRRWFLSEEELPGSRSYRPKPLRRHEAAIEAQRPLFRPDDDGSDRRIHVVAPGEALRAIAQREVGGASRADEIFDLNRDVLDHPDDIFPGDQLRLPDVILKPSDNQVA